jgi:hypothetical protein
MRRTLCAVFPERIRSFKWGIAVFIIPIYTNPELYLRNLKMAKLSLKLGT